MSATQASEGFEPGFPSFSREAEENRRLRAEADGRSRAAADEIVRAGEALGQSASVLEMDDDPTYLAAVLFSRPAPETGREPRVRVYRGINKLDASVYNQAAYAMRFREDDAPDMEVQEHLRELVDALAERPTYANLFRYVEAVWPDLSDKQVRELDRELRGIEDGVLERGHPLRLELASKTFARTGGFYADTGIAPYLSASTDAQEASGYGRRGVMVLDVPVSKLEALYAGPKGEVVVKGSIPPEYISAILVKKSAGESSGGGRAVPESVERALPAGTLSPEAVDQTYRAIRENERAQDAATREEDIHLIGERRVGALRQRYPDAMPGPDAVARIRDAENADEYTATKRGMFDLLADRYEAAGGSRESLSDDMVYRQHYDFDRRTTVRERYDRAAATDDMLENLRRIVIDQERYFAMRNAADSLAT